MRILVTGAAGLVGSELASIAGHEVVSLTRAELDIADRHAVDEVFGAHFPDAVINCAADSDVDRCEREPSWAMLANALGPRNLAIACSRLGAHLVHVSTDYVFSGDKPEPYDEWDEPAPISAYGRSKLGGEREVMRHASSWAIARTALVFGSRRPTFVDNVLSRARASQPIRAAENLTGSPTCASDVARVLGELAAQRVHGLFHVVNEGSCTRYALAREVLELAGLDPALATRVKASDLGLIAPRPANSALTSIALSRWGIDPLPRYGQRLAEHVGEAG